MGGLGGVGTRGSHIEPERVNVPQTARAIWCVAKKPVGGRQEDGFIATARKWQKGENECSRAG